MVLYPKDPHYKIHFEWNPATAIMIGISPPEGNLLEDNPVENLNPNE